MRCEFTIAPGVDVADPNARLGSLLQALGTDDRWTDARVEQVRQPDGWNVVVRVGLRTATTDALAQACSGVAEIVPSVVPGAAMLACGLIEPGDG